jgi:hypothetical protein
VIRTVPKQIQRRAGFSEGRPLDLGSRGDTQKTLTWRANSAIMSASGNAIGNAGTQMHSSPTAQASRTQRSRVSNGTAILPGVDGRSALARRYRDLVAALSADLEAGQSQAAGFQIRNAASLQLHAEELTARLVRGEAIDPEAITRATNGANRALAALRPKPAANRRRPGQSGGSVTDYLARRPALTPGGDQ